MDNSFEQTATDFANLDFSVEEARLTELEAERANIDSAIERANARRTEIARKLREWRDLHRESAKYVADALLDGSHATEATAVAVDERALNEEEANLAAGVFELRRRSDDVHSEMRTLRIHAAGKAALVAQPMVDALRARAKRSAEELLECFAGLQALHTAIQAGGCEVGQVNAAAAGCIGQGKLLAWRSQLPVPEMVSQVLNSLPQAKVLRPGRAQSVPAPECNNSIGLIAGILAKGS